MILNIKLLNPDATLPQYSTENAGCFDIYASMDSQDYGRCICPTGLAFEIPPGHVLSIRSRSGLAFKDKVHAFPGTVDADYRGEVMVLLNGEHPGQLIQIKKGDRIAQGIIEVSPATVFAVVDQLSETVRGTGGLGSTGS